MTGHDPTRPNRPVEADPVSDLVADPAHDRAPSSADLPHARDSAWTDAQRIVVGVIVAIIAVIALVLVVFVFPGPDEETVPTPTVPAPAVPSTAAPAIAPSTPSTASIAPPPSS